MYQVEMESDVTNRYHPTKGRDCDLIHIHRIDRNQINELSVYYYI